jgi:hypothetical protein
VSLSFSGASSRSRIFLGTGEGGIVAEVAGQGTADSLATMMRQVEFGPRIGLG